MSFIHKNNSNFKNCYSISIGDFLYTAISLNDYSAIILRKTDFSGNTIWIKKITGEFNRYKVRGFLKFSNNDLLILVQCTGISDVSDKYWMLRVSTNGVIVTKKKILFSPARFSTVNKFRIINNDRFYIIFDDFLVVFDSQCNVLLQKTVTSISNQYLFTLDDILYHNSKLLLFGELRTSSFPLNKNRVIIEANADLGIITREFKCSQEASMNFYDVEDVYVTGDNKIIMQTTSYISKPFQIGDNQIELIRYAGGIRGGDPVNFFYDKVVNRIYCWWRELGSFNICKLDNSYNSEWYRKIEYEEYILSTEIIERGTVIKGYTTQNTQTIWGKLNHEFESCLTQTSLEQNIFSSFVINFNEILPNISITDVRNVVSEETLPASITSFSISMQEICPPVYDYVLILESVTINVPVLKTELIPDTFVGNILISNNYTASATLVAGTIIASENGVDFKVQNTTIIGANSSQNVPIVISGYPIETGSFSALINSTKFDNPNAIHINFNVIRAIIDAEIIDVSLFTNTYIKNHLVVPNPDAYGNITIQNNSLSYLVIPEGTVLCTEPQNNFIFKTSIPYEAKTTFGETRNAISIGPMATGIVNVDISLSNDNNNSPKVINNYQILINEIKPDQYTTIRNPHNFKVNVNVIGNGTSVDFDDNTLLQSPNFNLLAVGSNGQDSPASVQLRWIFGGDLGDKHLPKGNLASNYYNYSKPDDFVKIYKAPYVETFFSFSFSDHLTSVNNSKAYWIYKYPGDGPTVNSYSKVFYVYFLNTAKYNDVLLTNDPFRDPIAFITAYGENIIEVESKEDLFFAANPYYPRKTSFNVQMEAFSVEENKMNAPKVLAYRGTINQTDLKKIFCENGRSIRYKSNKVIAGFDFEFYSDFITFVSQNSEWQLIDNFSLSTDNNVVIQRLDPQPVNNPVHGNWLRYNDGAYVNTANYLEKWESPTPFPPNSLQGDIKSSVNKYISITDTNPLNPKAIEDIDINGTIPDEGVILDPQDDEMLKISHLDMLNIAAIDFHTARMLGLGTLDMSPEVISGESFIYLSVYNTLKDVNNVSITKDCQLMSMSLPTSIHTQRLSLPVDIAEIKFGPAFDTPESQNLCDEDGYTFDGKFRIVKFQTKEIPEGEIYPPFFANNAAFDASTFTLPVYGGLEHRYYTEIPDHILTEWTKPELLFDKKFKNIDVFPDSYESIPIMLPLQDEPFYTHRQSQSGYYDYAAYGINIFSRATASTKIFNVETHLKPKNTLLPTSENNAWLIMKEKPLMFTSQYEQDRYKNNILEDKTLVRISFSYDYQDIVTHKIPSDSIVLDEDYLRDNTNFPDEYDIFADEVEIFYRDVVPRTISAGVYAVEQHTDQLQVVFKTKNYYVASTGETYPSKFPDGTAENNFIGGIFLLNDVSYIINHIEKNNNDTELYFSVFKKEVSAAIMSGTEINLNAQGLSFPQITDTELCTATENMQTPGNWGNQNPNSLRVNISNQWDIHREIIYAQTEFEEIKYLEKSRGIWGDATVEPFEDNDGNPAEGVYIIRFNNLKLNQHQQFNANSKSVEFFNGKVRLYRKSTFQNGKASESRESFKVIKTENISSSQDLVLHIVDTAYNPLEPENEILTGNIKVNYYPGYCVYLYAEQGNNLVKESVLPPPDLLTKYSVFGLRTIDTDITYNDGNFYKSKFCPPILLFGQNVKEPLIPEKPKGVLYATRPDFYGKSTYSFTTEFQQIPFSIQLYRSDDEAILNALYEQATIKTIKENLNLLGGYNESFLTNRWENFFDFDALASANEYGKYPEGEENEYKFPLPDKISFYEEINLFITKYNAQFGTSYLPVQQGIILPDNLIINGDKPLKLIDFIKEAIYYTFVPLTEIPVLYQYIKSRQEDDYMPVNKKQNIRDQYGALLPQESSEFDMAPMMTKLAEKTVLFTDFTLDGTTDNICFYASREIGTQMEQSEMSGILGPVRLVNSNPPDTPKISKATPVLENKVLGIQSKVKVEIQPYPEVQKIDKISLYRATNRLDAESILSMSLVSSYNLSDVELENGDKWTIDDELSDFENIPYGDVLYYRVTVARKIQYSEPVSGDTPPPVVIDYAPSQASKIMAIVLSETQNPEAPELEGSGQRPAESDFVNNVILSWNQTCYKGSYHLYNMSPQGNWAEIARLIVNQENNKAQLQIYNPNPAENENEWVDGDLLDIVDNEFVLPLNLLGTNYTQFPLFDENDNRKYYHFKAVAENTSGMFSTEEKILTLFNDEVWNNLLGISSDGTTNGMIIEKTFIIK